MTSLNGYIQGLGSGADRIVRKTGTEIKLSVYDDIDSVIVFNEEGETSQKTLTGKNLLSYNVTTQTVSGVDFDFYDDGSIHIHGTTNASNCFLNLNYVSLSTKSIPSGSYKVNIKGGSTARLQIISSGSVVATLSGSSFTDVSIPNDATSSWARILVSWSAGTTVDETVYPMICRASETSTDYEPYCGGVPSPNPSYPQAIEGIGFKRPDGTYSVSISYDDGDEHFGSITASGLAYPLYDGDILDFVNSKVIRKNGLIDMSALVWVKYPDIANVFMARGANFPTKKEGLDNFLCNVYPLTLYEIPSMPDKTTKGNATAKSVYVKDSDFATDWTNNTPNNFTTAMTGNYLVYELADPVEEYITITGGDITDIGTATVTAEGTLTVTYDKAEMAIRKYSAKPDWSKIGYESTPNAVIDAFNYSKQIYDTWSFNKFTGNLNLRIFPNVDISGELGLNVMFKGCTNLINLPPLEIGTDTGTLNASEFARNSGIEEVDITSNNLNQENNFQNGFNGCTFLKSYSITAKVSNPSYMFSGCSSLTEATDFDTSTASDFREMFSGCSSLTYVSDDFNTASGTNFYRCFYNCSSLESIPSWNLRSGTNLQQLFAGCSSIKNVPPLVITAATNLTNMFQNSGSNLTDTSRNNILMMLATASAYTGTKTLAAVGFTSSMYSAASWQALAKYSDFIDSGWAIGYS